MGFFLFGYLGFMAMATAIYLALPQRLRRGWLALSGLLFSLLFFPEALLYLTGLLLLNYCFGKWIARYPTAKRALLTMGILGNAVWFILYRTGISQLPADLVKWAGFGQSQVAGQWIVLQIGALFAALQSISYLLDIYRGRLQAGGAINGFVSLAAYILFFPKLLAGPLEEPHRLISQFSNKVTFKRQLFMEGGSLILWGLFQKMVIADRMAAISSAVLADPSHHFGWELVLGACCFALQLYADLCAYTDISVGFAHMMGFRLPHHFNLPFAADRPYHYWNNYMVSLSRWVKETIPFPRITRGRIGKKLLVAWTPAICVALLAAGNGLGFALWGLIWVASIMGSKSARNGANAPLALPFASRWLVWVSAATASSFLAFSTWTDGIDFYLHLPQQLSLEHIRSLPLQLGVRPLDLWFAAIAFIAASATGYGKFDAKVGYPQNVMRVYERKRWKRWAVYYAFIILLLVIGDWTSARFIFGF